MNRRGFLKSILASASAPYVITTAGVLMPVKSLAMPTVEDVMFVQSGSGATTLTWQDAFRFQGWRLHNTGDKPIVYAPENRIIQPGDSISIEWTEEQKARSPLLRWALSAD